jgi:DNA repair protein SbcC/Rad50
LKADFSLVALEAEGFRGFNSRRPVDFDDHLTIISGNNGVGKSSVLGGVEWCLYGDVAFINYLDSKVRDELVNQSHPEGTANIVLTLRKDKETIRVARSKKLGTRATHLTLNSSSGQFEDELAEKEAYQLFGLTLDDFIRAVYLHQESVRGLLTDDPRIRDEALDRLFGLERLRNLVGGIPIKDIRDDVEELNGKKEKLGEKIKGALAQIQLDLNKLRGKAKDLGLSEQDITFEKALELTRSIQESLDSISKKYGMPEYSIPVPSEVTQLAVAERKAKQALKEYETTIIGGTEASEHGRLRGKLEDLLDDRRKGLDGKSEYHKQIAEVTSRYGSREEITARIDGLTKNTDELVERRKHLDAHSRLLEDAIQDLSASTIKVCPVCNQTIDQGEVLSRLRVESQRHLGEEIHEIDAKQASMEQQAKELSEKLGSLDTILADMKGCEEAVASIDSQLNEILDTHLRNDELVRAATIKVQELKTRIAEMDQAYSTRAKKIQEARQLIEQSAAISSVLEKSSEFDEVNKHFQDESRAIQSIDEAVTELQKLERTLETIVRAVSSVQVGLASGMIQKAENDISSYYSRLCGHPYYDKIKVEVKPRELRGLVRNSYSIKAFSSKDSKETFVSSRFSTGQMNCVALAIYLALTKVLPVSFGFMLLDDPSQNLDPAHKEALVDLLNEVMQERQVVVATQDSELVSMMKSEIPAHKEYRFSDWGSDGPKVTVGKPE